MDSITVFISNYITPDDTVFPGDTLALDCDIEYVIAPDTLYFDNSFLTPCDSVFEPVTEWVNIWGTEGDSLVPFFDENGVFFKRIMIPIIDSIWFRPDFQFRFINYVSLSVINSWKSNTDQWNIDNVYLNTGRSASDTTYQAIKFAGRAPSFLDKYQEMPYSQYSINPFQFMDDSVKLKIANMDEIQYNCIYQHYFIAGTDTIYTYEGGSADVFPYLSTGYMTYPPFASPPVSAYFPGDPLSVADSVGFLTAHSIVNTENGELGDTIMFVQSFKNYFAYDDGTAEAGYGLTPAGSLLGYRFELVQPDTLRALQIYFNKVQDSANKQLFNIVIWNDNNGKPGNVLYIEENIYPVFEDGLNTMNIYHLENDSIVYNGVIYIGWEQNTYHNLNVGFDRNTHAESNIFFNVDGTWKNTEFEGSLMIRPVFGKRLVEKPPPQPPVSVKSLEIFPRPPIQIHR